MGLLDTGNAPALPKKQVLRNRVEIHERNGLAEQNLGVICYDCF